MRLLIVEPAPMARFRLKLWLKPSYNPARVLFADNDEAGLALCSTATHAKAPFVTVIPRSSALTMLYRAAAPESYIVAAPPADALQAKLDALNAGADILLPRPWAPEDLLATLRVADRRFLGHGSNLIEAGPLLVDTKAREVWLNFEPITGLTTPEFNIIRVLAARPRYTASHRRMSSLLARPPYRSEESSLAYYPKVLRGLKEKLAAKGLADFVKSTGNANPFEPGGLVLNFAAILS